MRWRGREVTSIALVSLAGGTPTKIPFGGYASNPAWAPSGEAVAFAGHDPVGFDIYVQRSRAEQPVKLAGDRAWELNPRWSPDGTQVAFISQKNGNADIAVVPAAGGPVRFVTNTPADEDAVQWTPDGRSFVLSAAESKSELVSTSVTRLLARKPATQ